MDRREFLQWMGIGAGGSLLAGCDLSRNSEKLIPYLVPPEDGAIPGDATYVATSCTECTAACGVSARIREHRPVKVDGLAGHPVNDGALCVRGQSSINRLYNPERIRQPLMQDGNGSLAPVTWNQALARIVRDLGTSTKDNVYLSGRTSGSMTKLVGEFCDAMNARRLPEFEAVSHAAVREANDELFGLRTVPTYHIDKADFLLTLGADILETYQFPTMNAHAVAHKAHDEHFGWYHVESTASMTGFQARQRVAVKPGSETWLLAYLLGELRSRRVFGNRRLDDHAARVPSVSADEVARATGMDSETVVAIRDAFLASQHPLIIAGGSATSHEHGLDVARITALLQMAAGMMGSTVDFTHAADDSRVGTMRDMDDLADRLRAGSIGVMFVAGTDPVGRLGSDFEEAMDKAGVLVGIGDTLNDSMKACDVVLPLSHYLESWGDASPYAGVVNVIQPAFKPLFDTRSDGDVLLSIMAEAGKGGLEYQQYLLASWAVAYGADGSRALVEKGFYAYSTPAVDAALKSGPTGRYTFADAQPIEGDCLAMVPSVRWYDGRSRELPLLNEIPDPLTAVTYGDWVSVSPATAKAKGVGDRDEVEISAGEWSAKLPVRLQPGLTEGVFQVHMGAADVPRATMVASGEAEGFVTDVTVRSTGARPIVAIMSGSLSEQGRGAVPGNPPAHFGHGEEHHGEESHEDVSFNPEPNYPEYRWAMAVDMDMCVGCSACVSACYIENNVPMTGPDEHMKGREMSWLKLEPYYDEEDNGDFVLSMCQHCDWAPCEAVCPVIATYHNDEGLNAQVYNRCVGTRYCANNCPYKQRRFNWFSWEHRPEPLNLMTNPDVSMRGKGIMEKCSFCVQRIRKARDVAKDENRKIQEGDFTTACAQACPGNAIVFGNLKDENSAVAQWARSERSNQLLTELGTGPAVYYLRTKEGDDHGHHE